MASVLVTRDFWADALERAVKSFIQGFLVTGGMLSASGGAVTNVTIQGFPWNAALLSGSGMAILSIGMSILSAPRSGTASFTKVVAAVPSAATPAVSESTAAPQQTDEGEVPFRAKQQPPEDH